MTPNVIFVHSLFRAGSTYFFNVFRRSKAGYWCYQEPLHEAAFFMKDDPEALLKFNHHSSEGLRHSKLDQPYFQELYEVNEVWRDVIKEDSIYNHYFTQGDADQSIPYFHALISAAKGVPMMQECRTSSRIASLKNALQGVHIYLWRNPWDQWWSYHVNDYFNAVTQLLLGVQEQPVEVANFCKEINFQAFKGDYIRDQLEYYRLFPLSSADGYQAFYLLWCLGLREGITNADVMVNIDKLSFDVDYRAEISQAFEALGVNDCDFQDCHIPVATYGKQDLLFFQEQEDKIHSLLLSSGWSQEQLAQLIAIRGELLSDSQKSLPQSESEKRLLRDAERGRSLARRFLDMRSTRNAEVEARIALLQAKVDKLHKSSNYWWRVANEHALEVKLLKQGGVLASIRRALLVVTKLRRHLFTKVS